MAQGGRDRDLASRGAGGAVTLSTARGSEISTVRLGPDFPGADQLQAVVEPGQWQAAEAGADWVLVACVVAPAFEFTGFEMAAEGWKRARLRLVCRQRGVAGR